MRRALFSVVVLSAIAVVLSACGVMDDGPDGPIGNTDDGQARTAGIALTSDTLGNTDVAGIRLTLRECATNDYVVTAIKDLEDMFLPGGISPLEGAPYDSDSQHIFADHYFLVAAGCYDAVARPLKADGSNSADCDPARKNDIDVEDGETTEITLISQCKGPENGGLDAIGSVNHPPEIQNLVFESSKFVGSCQQDTRVCATVNDPDGDPQEFVWSSTSGGSLQGDIVQSSVTRTNGTQFEVCARFKTGQVGDYSFRLQAYDQATNEQGQMDRIENILQGQCQAQNTTCQSSDQINFPVYAGEACQGRSSTILMSMSNSPGPRDQGFAVPLIRQTARWVNPVTTTDTISPSILYVLDDNHNNEHGVDGVANGPDGDAQFVTDALIDEFGAANVDWIDEPSGGLSIGDIENYDVVWFSNPGFPLDDTSTRDTLIEYRDRGNGLVLQGNDMAGDGGGASLPDMSALTFLQLDATDSNGATTCGVQTDSNAGANYDVSFSSEPIAPLVGPTDLRGQAFQYGNDIDHTSQQPGATVMATANFQNENCPNGVSYPAAVTVSPLDLP